LTEKNSAYIESHNVWYKALGTPVKQNEAPAKSRQPELQIANV